MKRYLVFNGFCAPTGGWHDFYASYDFLGEAVKACANYAEERSDSWSHIVDTETWEILPE